VQVAAGLWEAPQGPGKAFSGATRPLVLPMIAFVTDHGMLIGSGDLPRSTGPQRRGRLATSCLSKPKVIIAPLRTAV